MCALLSEPDGPWHPSLSLTRRARSPRVSERGKGSWVPKEEKCQGPDMAWLVHGCPSSSFSRSKSLCFVCWCLSFLVLVCVGCCSCQSRAVILPADFGKIVLVPRF